MLLGLLLLTYQRLLRSLTKWHLNLFSALVSSEGLILKLTLNTSQVSNHVNIGSISSQDLNYIQKFLFQYYQLIQNFKYLKNLISIKFKNFLYNSSLFLAVSHPQNKENAEWDHGEHKCFNILVSSALSGHKKRRRKKILVSTFLNKFHLFAVFRTVHSCGNEIFNGKKHSTE